MPKKLTLRELLMRAARQPEYNSGEPVEAPIGFSSRPELLHETVARLVKQQLQETGEVTIETLEDANDLDVSDDDGVLGFDPTAYELVAMQAEEESYDPDREPVPEVPGEVERPPSAASADDDGPPESSSESDAA